MKTPLSLRHWCINLIYNDFAIAIDCTLKGVPFGFCSVPSYHFSESSFGFLGRFFIKGIQIFSEDFTQFQHSKSIRRPKFQLHKHLALHCEKLSESALSKKIHLCPLSLQWPLPRKVIFGGFGSLTYTQALMNKRKVQIPRKITLQGNWHSTAPRRATNVTKLPL